MTVLSGKIPDLSLVGKYVFLEANLDEINSIYRTFEHFDFFRGPKAKKRQKR
jgi:hypothetical protein